MSSCPVHQIFEIELWNKYCTHKLAETCSWKVYFVPFMSIQDRLEWPRNDKKRRELVYLSSYSVHQIFEIELLHKYSIYEEAETWS